MKSVLVVMLFISTDDVFDIIENLASVVLIVVGLSFRVVAGLTGVVGQATAAGGGGVTTVTRVGLAIGVGLESAAVAAGLNSVLE